LKFLQLIFIVSFSNTLFYNLQRHIQKIIIVSYINHFYRSSLSIFPNSSYSQTINLWFLYWNCIFRIFSFFSVDLIAGQKISHLQQTYLFLLILFTFSSSSSFIWTVKHNLSWYWRSYISMICLKVHNVFSGDGLFGKR